MKLKMLTVASVGLSFVIGGGLIGCKQPVHVFDTADSPIDIAGGSIYASIKAGQQWTPQGCDKKCTATSNHIDQIFTKGVSGVPPTVPLPNGWVIKVSNKDKNSKEKLEAVKICSNPKCDGNDLGDGKTIYLETRGNSRWTLNGANQLRFHDNDCDGDTGTSEDKDCDFLVKVRIEHPKGTTIWEGKCTDPVNGDGHCEIGIGKP
jgi:hypothetical protein